MPWTRFDDLWSFGCLEVCLFWFFAFVFCLTILVAPVWSFPLKLTLYSISDAIRRLRSSHRTDVSYMCSNCSPIRKKTKWGATIPLQLRQFPFRCMLDSPLFWNYAQVKLASRKQMPLFVSALLMSACQIWRMVPCVKRHVIPSTMLPCQTSWFGAQRTRCIISLPLDL